MGRAVSWADWAIFWTETINSDPSGNPARDEVSSVATPERELKAFARVDLKPGEKKTVTLIIPQKRLTLFNRAMEEVVEPGKFDIMVGHASDDIRLQKTIIIKMDNE